MKGYYTANGFCGYINGVMMMFGSQSDYYDELEASSDNWNGMCDKYEMPFDREWN